MIRVLALYFYVCAIETRNSYDKRWPQYYTHVLHRAVKILNEQKLEYLRGKKTTS